MRRYGSIDEIAKEYALTNEQLLDYLLSNDIDAISDLDKIDLNNKNIMAILDRINRNKKLNNHNNLTSFESIEIEGLFGKYNYLINFRDDISIWVSENGIGKTTILNIIVAILTSDQKTLMDINFKKVIVNISGESYQIDREQYFQVNSNNNRYSKRIKELLEELNKYKNIPMFKQYSVIDFLRNNFPNDKILIDVLNNFIKDKTYNTAEKASLLTYPEGTLYLYKNGQPQVVDCTNLANELYNKYSSLDTSIKQFIKKYNKEEFDDTVMTISHVYQRGLIE